LFVWAFLCAAFAALETQAQASIKSTSQPPHQQTTSAGAQEEQEENGSLAEEAAERQAPPEPEGLIISAVKRNFSTRYGVDLTRRDKQSVAMNPQDAQTFAAFLERKDAGFVRLYDVADCEMNQRILKVSDQCPANMRGRGTSYSFRRKKYQTGWFSDLKIQRGALQATGLNVLGFMTDLGDAPLLGVSLENEAIKMMLSFQPSEQFETVREQARESARGFKIGSYFFRSAHPIKENNTYALRAIAFRGEILQRSGIFRVNVLEGDKREDIIVVFRVIRRHANGSVSLIWRELQRTRSPKLIFPKRDKKGKRD
jgi:hypothetical protein